MPWEFGNYSNVRTILISHSKRYPHWNVTDLYKLIHQAAMGSEHAATDEAGARKWLVEEIRNMGNGPDERLIDTIAPDGIVVRVHLRPLVQAKLDTEQILQAFIKTAQEFHGSTERLELFGKESADVAAEGIFPFSAQEVTAYIERMKEKGFPAVHHSPAFESMYRPAYRVVDRNFLPASFIATTNS